MNLGRFCWKNKQKNGDLINYLNYHLLVKEKDLNIINHELKTSKMIILKYFWEVTEDDFFRKKLSFYDVEPKNPSRSLK